MEVRTRIASLADFKTAKLQAMSGIADAYPDLSDDSKNNIEWVLGELLGNIAKHSPGGDEVIIQTVAASGFLELCVEAQSIRENCDMLSLALGHAQVCVDHGIGCDFLANGHGLGHYIIARFSTESSYENGSFKAKFDLLHDDARKKVGTLVDMAFV